jgi:hypothetical protein
MAYDLIKDEWYNINFHSIINLCKANKNISPYYNQLDKWENILIKLDNELLGNVKSNRKAVLKYAYSNEIFQFPFTFSDGQTYIYQFNITSIGNELEKIRYSYFENFPLSYFSENQVSNAYYQYTDIKNVGKNYLIKKPIVIASFKNVQTIGIVIDGNHRVSACKKYNVTTIQGIDVLPKLSIAFGTPLDFAMYLFYNDLQSFCIKYSQGYPPDFLLKDSLFRFLKP